MDKWGFSYVENLTWVHMAPNNTVVAAPSLYARRSHLSLFIFRKSGAPAATCHVCCKRMCGMRCEQAAIPDLVITCVNAGAVLDTSEIPAAMASGWDWE